LRRALVHPRLGVKLTVAIVAAACIAVAVQFAIASNNVGTNLQRLEERRLQEDLVVATNAVEQMQMNLKTAAAGQAAAEGVLAAVKRRDVDYIFEDVSSWISTVYDMQVTVLDRRGGVIDFVGPPPLADLKEESAVQRTLNGVVSAEFVFREGRLWLLGAAPIMRGGSLGESHGTLVLAEPIDDRFARAISAITNTQITIFVHGKAGAASDRAVTGLLEEPGVPDQLRVAEAVVRTGGYATKAVSLGVADADAYLAVSSERAPITTAQRALRRAMVVALLLAVALATVVALVLAVQFGRPLRSLRTAVSAIAFGDLEHRVKTSGDDEIADLGRAFNAMAERVAVSQDTLRRAAVRDSLTGLLNHREFYRRLTDEIARCERGNMPLSVMMIDIDHFKDVNDTFGHLRGDAVLREVASLITRCVREEDVVARYAGDEFAIILPGVAEGTALRVADRIMDGAEGVAFAVGMPGDQQVTLSIGVAARWPGEHTATRTVELADEALYRAKDSGRNRVVVADDIAV
jgi:diguanylate cyclase (GGDEF)-like protein